MSGPIVCNAGPLVALALLDRLALLNALFSRAMVPERVYLEVLEGGKDGAGVDAVRAASGLEVISSIPQADQLLTAMLDEGEAAVISLAKAEGIPQVLIDERKGRKIARNIYGLTVIGTARVLVEGKLRGFLPSVGAELQALTQHGYWLGENVIAEACRLAGE